MDTYGGRDLGMIEVHMEKAKSRRAPRGPNELGQIDIEGLMMSLHSRLASHTHFHQSVSVMLAVPAPFLAPLQTAVPAPFLAPLQTAGWNRGFMMTGAHPGQGFPLHMCEDLLEVLLDFLEEVFKGDEDEDEGEGENSDATATAKNKLKKYPVHQELIKLALEEGTHPFAGLDDDPCPREQGTGTARTRQQERRQPRGPLQGATRRGLGRREWGQETWRW
ncbi:hypothetical protein BOTBODRAFT_622379 [Botryobasidium botryosum FD-172 SS1]|uniref:Uncharacterized protein n=1 Tax=Botryobasidium botryosum (strain FD-172 SS1) TaxID=930990 RepID=A0A067MXG7_BOTB1|nr:hypothetical protein BOTBODRAFT_622379 [Botryobasidium botryosum FD-172 SS1]